MPGILMRHRSVFSAIDVRFPYGHLRRVDPERDLVSQGPKRVRIQHTVRPLRHVKVGVVDERLPPDREWQDDGPVAAFGRYRVEQLDELWWQHVNETFAAVRDERVPVHEAPDSAWEGVGDAGDHHAAVAVADKNNVPEVVHYHVVNNRANRLGQSNGLRIPS